LNLLICKKSFLIYLNNIIGIGVAIRSKREIEMKKNMEPWSKRVWYAEALIFMISLTLIGNIIAFLVVNIIALVATIIASITLRVSEPIISKPQKPLSQAHDKIKVKSVMYDGNNYPIDGASLILKNKNIKNITDIQGIDKLWYLKRLDLSRNNITSLDGIEHLENLRILKLSNNKIQDIQQIKNLQNLVKVYLNNNQLKELNSSDFNSDLKHLDIAENPIEKFQIYTRDMYDIINFGSKKDFPKQEIDRLKKLKRGKTY